MSSKKIILIKLGGSAITDKDKAKTPNISIIKQLAIEIAQARKNTSDLIILGHGQGSFAHRPASKYKTKEGFINNESLTGLSIVRQECLELNLVIIQELIKAGIPAVTLEPFAFLSTKNKKVEKIFLNPFLNILSQGVVPVVYGDVISDSQLGWTIYSGETVLNIIAQELAENGYQSKLIIEVGKTNGVYDTKESTIPVINQNNYDQIQEILRGSDSIDVTGGMLHKVTEAFQLAQKGVPSLLISTDENNLKKAILGEKVTGTWIK